MIRRPPRSTLFPTRRSSDLGSTLLARLLSGLGLEGFDDLVRWTATATPPQVAGLAPHVLNAAREGEAVALRILRDAAGGPAAPVRAPEGFLPGAGGQPGAPAGGPPLAPPPPPPAAPPD